MKSTSLLGLSGGSVEKTGFSRSQPHADEERQRPEMEIEVILARGRRVFNQVRLWQPEHAGGVGTLPDFAAHTVTNLLRWSVDPVVFHAIQSEYVASSPLKIRERTDRDRSRFDLQRLWVEPKLLP